MIELWILAATQGLTEFLPVSSSGHMVLVQQWFNIQMPGVQIEIALHLATLFSICVYFHRDIFNLFKPGSKDKPQVKWLTPIAVSVLITGCIGLLFKDWIIENFHDIRITSISLIVAGFVIFATRFTKPGNLRITIWVGVLFGLVQTMALLPGVSRSGSTIALLLFLGVNREEAFKFSFIAVLPLLLAASLLELDQGLFSVYGAFPTLMAMLIAFVIGLITLSVLQKMMLKQFFYIFGYYCMAIGVFSLINS
ncbi:MAG: undecaprenyl-diphosphatase [Candidatus Omnitrophota bacterium]|jgi:undecaprenyl-diphosphatase